MTKMDISCTCVYCNIYSVNFIPGCFYLKNQYCCTKLFIIFFPGNIFIQYILRLPKQQITDLSKLHFSFKQENWPKLNCVSAITHTLVMQCVIKKSLLIYGMYFCLFLVMKWSLSCSMSLKVKCCNLLEKTTTWHFQLTRFLGKFDFAKTFLHHPRNVLFLLNFLYFCLFLVMK